MYRNLKLVPRVVFGHGSFAQLDEILSDRRSGSDSYMVFLLDDVFMGHPLKTRVPAKKQDLLLMVNVDDEPKTGSVDKLVLQIKTEKEGLPAGVIGIGGGSVMDYAKAVALMLTNKGSAANYQGWDLIKNPAVYHVGIPTLSGTGSEISRTTILTGPTKKLGINSDYTVFDQIVLDPDLISDVPKEQWFYTGMDCYVHCIESLSGTFLNAFSRSYGEKSLELCRDVFLNDAVDDRSDRLMMASYFGGLSIGYSQVGVCHALSYGLSFVLGIHHGIGNCIVFNYLDEFYHDGVQEFRMMAKKHGIELPRNVTADLSGEQIEKMVDVALILEPLWENALGSNWRHEMTRGRIQRLYARM